MNTSTFRLEAVPPCSVAARRVLLLTAALWFGTVSAAPSSTGMPWEPEPWPLPPEEAVAAEIPGASAPLDRETIARLLGEAEAAYQGGRWSQAMEAFRAVTAFDAGNPFAWLRIGNLQHRRGQLLAAASAYRKAAGPLAAAMPAGSAAPRASLSPPASRGASAVAAPSTSDASSAFAQSRSASTALAASAATEPLEMRQARVKALINLASVNLELAEAALAQAQKLGHPQPASAAQPSVSEEIEARLAAAADRVAQAGASVDASNVSNAPGVRQAPRRDRRDPPQARPARSGGGRGGAEATAGRPVVEYLRGAPQP